MRGLAPRKMAVPSAQKVRMMMRVVLMSSHEVRGEPEAFGGLEHG